MHKCINCTNETINPKFCSRSCSATYNNKKYQKRFKQGTCVCGKLISKNRTYCKDCFTLYRRTKHILSDQYKHVKNSRNKRKLMAIDLLGGKCIVCGYGKCNRSLQFHHLDPSIKSFTISTNINKPWNLVEKELKKCVLVCANCHGEIEAGIVYL